MVNPLGVPPRLEGATELLDRAGFSDADVRGSLRDLDRLNRLFGGTQAVLGALSQWLPDPGGGSIAILDIGTGGAGIPRAVCGLARRRGIPVVVEALDRNEQVVAAAAEWVTSYPEIRLRRAEVPPLPYPDRSFDCAIASLLFHHLDWPQGVYLLREMRRVARRGIIVNDLARSRRARALAAVAVHLLSRNRLTRHDGPMSVRRGFRPEELRRMAREAGLGQVAIRCQPWFRLVLVAPGVAAAEEERP